jgi:hypothetical protein
MFKNGYFCCPFCMFRDTALEVRNNHVVTLHQDSIVTDYDPDTGKWAYWRPIKKEVKHASNVKHD